MGTWLEKEGFNAEWQKAFSDNEIDGVLQCAAVCCSVLQCVAVCCSGLQCLALSCSMLQCGAVCVL